MFNIKFASRFILACSLALSSVYALAASLPGAPVAGVRIEIFALASDPPGEIREAPGGGRVLTPAVIYMPTTGENIHGPAIVMLGAGPGSNPAKQSEASRWAAERLAARGYTVLSIQSHLDRGFPLFSFEETVFEINAVLSALEARGYETFVLAGQSYGAIAAANYVATNPDPSLDKAGERRVKAVVLFDPLTEVRRFPGLGLEKNYEAMMEKAKAAFATGRNGYPPGRTLVVAGGVPGDSWLGSGNFVAPAEAFLDYWGTDAVKRNESALRNMPVPSLMLVGEQTATVSIARLKAAQAASKARMDLQTYAGILDDKQREQQVNDMVKWLTAQNQGPSARIEQRIVDTVTANGQSLPGVVYLPTKIDPNKPALMMIHGRSGDVIQSSTHWMGWRLAQKGYVVLSPSLRISGVTGIQTSNRAEVVEDIAAWMNKLASLGYKKVVATGHSNGGIWISDYVALRKDPRVVGMAYMAPTANVLTWEERKADPKKVAMYEEARVAVERGEGTSKVFGIQSANLAYDSDGPNAVSHPERLAQFKLPGLFITGTKDGLFTNPNVLERLRTAYKGKLTELRYENGTHGLRESKDRLATDIDAWIKQTFPAK